MRHGIRRVAYAAIVAAAAIASVPAPAADIFKGRQTYATYCASCHGANGVSTMPLAPNLARGEGMMQPDAMLLESLRRGRKAMPAFAGILTDREILDVIAFARTLR